MEQEKLMKNMFSKFLDTKINQPQKRNGNYLQGTLIFVFLKI